MTSKEKSQGPGKPAKAGARWIVRLGSLLLPALLTTGCSSMTTTDRGVLGGAALGAVAGTIVGSATGNPEAGAVIGAGLGGITGGVTGAAIENAERKAEQNAEVRLASAQRGPLGLEEIAQLAQQGVGDSVIIEQVRLTGAIYNLSADQIIWLKQQGVSDMVIREMQATAYRKGRPAPPTVVYEQPPTVIYRRVRPVVVCPPPRPRVGFGFTYIHRHGCH